MNHNELLNNMYWNNYDLSFILQQGIRYSVEITEPSRGYILEVFDAHFVLPNLGPIGNVITQLYLQLFTDVEVNSGGYLPSCKAAR